MEAKHIVFFGLLFFGIPAAVVVLRASERLQKVGMFLMIFMTPLVYSTGINFFTDKYYRGTARGFEILATDMLSLVIIGVLIWRWGFKNFKLTAPGTVLYLLYFALSCISVINADSLLHAGYELVKMGMMFLLFLAVYNYVRRFSDVTTILYAFSAIITLNLILMLVQKYAYGIYQPSGIFAHRNSMAMFTNMIAPIFLSILFNAEVSRKEFWFFGASFAFSALSIVLGLSRGAIFFFPFSAAIVIALSFLNGISTRKVRILCVLGILALAGIVKSAPMIIERFEGAPESSGQGRIELAKAAINMAEDKFFGVGINNWGIKINGPYTYTEGTNLEHPDDYKIGVVETSYLLVAAECGWIGLLAFLLWLGFYYVKNLQNLRAFAKTGLYYLPAGIAGGLFSIYGQSMLEWVLKQSTNFYQLMTIFAIIAVMTDLRNSTPGKPAL